jgi:glycosyltransferase involved in cell wall biosynthesis
VSANGSTAWVPEHKDIVLKMPTLILVLDNTFTFGGAINSLCHLLRALNKERFAPGLVTGQTREYLTNHFDCTWYHYVPKLPWVNDRVYRTIAALPIFRLRLFRKALNISRFLYWIVFITLPEALKYYRLGRKHRVDLVHLNNIFGSQLAGIIAAKLLGVPCVAHLRDFEEVHPLTRFYARLIDHHVAISGAIRDNLLQLGVPAGRITIVYDAIDLAEFNTEVSCFHLLREFNLASDQPRYGIFGRVIDWKGIREFLHAVRYVSEHVPGTKGFIVGGHSDGDEAFVREMQRLTVELNITDKVVFTGYRQDVPALMKLMDVIVHASKCPEPFGMVIIEAMAMEKPVVATRGGGPLDIVIEGETGYLVEMGDPDALGRAIINLLRQPDLAHQMGRQGRARAEEAFSVDRYAAQMERIFHDLHLKYKC